VSTLSWDEGEVEGEGEDEGHQMPLVIYSNTMAML
tara:strand:+ start:1216 stop:1320 length:105 start_codon:yes stop_codon:yes gene_type:complete